MGNKSDMKFIRTSDEGTANQLREAGFTEITERNTGTYCFINDCRKINFDIAEKEIVFTNMLCL